MQVLPLTPSLQSLTQNPNKMANPNSAFLDNLLMEAIAKQPLLGNGNGGGIQGDGISASPAQGAWMMQMGVLAKDACSKFASYTTLKEFINMLKTSYDSLPEAQKPPHSKRTYCLAVIADIPNFFLPHTSADHGVR